MVADGTGDADAAGFGQRLQPRRDIHPIAEDVTAIGDHVAEIDPDAEHDASLRARIAVALDHAALPLDGAAHGIDDAGELDQQPVPGGLHDAAAMLLYLRVHQFAPVAL